VNGERVEPVIQVEGHPVVVGPYDERFRMISFFMVLFWQWLLMARRSMTSLKPPGFGPKKALETHLEFSMGLRTPFSISLAISSFRKTS
jgi:hypothetical protein